MYGLIIRLAMIAGLCFAVVYFDKKEQKRMEERQKDKDAKQA
jgi:hypothetical protein